MVGIIFFIASLTLSILVAAYDCDNTTGNTEAIDAIEAPAAVVADPGYSYLIVYAARASKPGHLFAMFCL